MSHKTPVNPDGLPDPSGRYSHGIVSDSGRLLYVSGQISLSASGEVEGEGDIEAQARAAFENVQEVVIAAGGRMSDVVKLTIFITKREDFPIVSNVRGEFFSGAFPACSTVIVDGLVLPDLLVEIEAVAMLPSNGKRAAS